MPLALFRSKEETYGLVMDDAMRVSHFVLSGTTGKSDRKLYALLFNSAVYLSAPADVRVARLRVRTATRFGARIFEGGDMCEQNGRFIESAANDETNWRLAQHEQWKEELPCCVLRVDGTRSISANAEWIVEQYRGRMPH